MEYIICSKCGKKKRIDAFSPRKDNISGYRKTCKDCWYKICKAWQSKNLERFYKTQRKYMLTAKGYYTRLKCSSRYAGVTLNISKEDFIHWYNSQSMTCHYCGRMVRRHTGRMRYSDNMTIDRRDNQLGYELNNIVICCHSCNLIKGDMFSEQDMLGIASKYIKPKLEEMQNRQTK